MFGKILIGALVGVGAVAAAPFTGGGSLLGAASLAGSLAGAGTIAGAVGAGVAGATVSVKASQSKTKQDQSAGAARAKQELEGAYALKQEMLTQEVAEMMQQHREDEIKQAQWITTLFAVGISAANCDGEICDEEMQELKAVAAGIAADETLPADLLRSIDKMMKNPPSLPTVLAMIKKYGFTGEHEIDLFSQIIEVTIQADGKTEEVEKDFMKTWNKETLAA